MQSTESPPNQFNVEWNVYKDMIGVFLSLKLHPLSKALFSASGAKVVNQWLSTVQKYSNKECCVHVQTKRSFTFDELNKESNRLASILLPMVKPTQCVAVMLENSPEFLITWLALLKIGAFPAFINTNLRTKALQHVLQLSEASILIANSHLLDDSYSGVDLKAFKLLSFGKCTKPIPASVLDLSRGRSSEPDYNLRKNIEPKDPAAYIYTSGTTGLPKAAYVPHERVFLGMNFFGNYMGADENLRMYCSLPLYHSSAAIIAFGPVVTRGSTIILTTKFSASKFITECQTFRANGAIYIGELCRYLLNTPPSPNDTNHGLQFMIGNGLRPDIWRQFKARFGLKRIIEFYASTEGNIQLFNLQEGDKYGVGAIGRRGFIANLLNKIRIIKSDPITEEPIRGKDGFCIVCKPDEPGEAIAEIVPGDPTKDFRGYKGNDKGTQKKILRDVFKKGDMWFRSGDILKCDSLNYYYFMDRIGDTFRWKGENVSTTEVAEAISVYPGIEETNVYGVLVPGADGRAGMAALTVKPDFDLSGLGAHATKKLPSYAVPLFVRILPSMESTGTMKQIKHSLRDQGCDPSKISDPLYMLVGSEYKPFGVEEYQKLGVKSKL